MSYIGMTKYNNPMLAIAEFDSSSKIKKIRNRQEFITEMRREPLMKETLLKVGRKFKFTNEQFAQIAGVTTRTYQRQRMNSKISVSASENTLRLAELYKNGMLAFDNDEQSFQNWLNANIPSLGNKKPIDLITTGLGADQVNDELLRIEYSVVG
jgi:putative toxin-antitoxin system antitoxin component (TIGR02293 family)